MDACYCVIIYIAEPSSSQKSDSEDLEQTRICATKFNETGTSDKTIAIGLSLAAGGLGLIGGVIVIVVVLFVYYRRQKEKLKQKEEAADADMESDSDTQQRYKSRYHQANNNLSNSQVASFRRTVGNYRLPSKIFYENLVVITLFVPFIHSLLFPMTTP